MVVDHPYVDIVLLAGRLYGGGPPFDVAHIYTEGVEERSLGAIGRGVGVCVCVRVCGSVGGCVREGDRGDRRQKE